MRATAHAMQQQSFPSPRTSARATAHTRITSSPKALTPTTYRSKIVTPTTSNERALAPTTASKSSPSKKNRYNVSAAWRAISMLRGGEREMERCSDALEDATLRKLDLFQARNFANVLHSIAKGRHPVSEHLLITLQVGLCTEYVRNM